MVSLSLLWSHTSNFHKQLFKILCCTLATLSQKYGFTWALESSDHFWGNLAQNGLPDITLVQQIQFAQATPHFGQTFVLHLSC